MVRSHLYLASASPRRRELLLQIGVTCQVLPVDLDESPEPGESAEHYVGRLALDKARAALTLLGKAERTLILAADTAVVIGADILGKPRDAADAAAMLRRLSGGEHRVLSGVALIGADGRETSALSESRVRMRRIFDAEMAAYWATGEPADKAGGYAIQGACRGLRRGPERELFRRHGAAPLRDRGPTGRGWGAQPAHDNFEGTHLK